jgi:DNA-binding MarR family transcriptional regulator
MILWHAASVGFPLVPGGLSDHHDDDLREVERTVSEALGELPLDVQALLAVSNVFRAATALRTYLERSVLNEHRLSWSAFVTLFVLRVWGEQESHRLAAEVGVTPGTLSGVVDTLERRGLVVRRGHRTDGRRVLVKATGKGFRAVDSIMPRFNEQEVFVTRDLADGEREELSRLLRRILRTLDDLKT